MITLRAAEPARDRDDVEAGRAAAADKHGRARVDALVDGDLLDGADHVLGGDAQDRGGCLVESAARAAPRPALADRLARRSTSSRMAPPRK